jgi:glycosidase
MVGEVLEEDSAHTAFFQGGRTGWDGIDTQLPSVFDFNLWKTSTDVFTGKKPARALRDVLKYDGLYGNINNIALLTGNHDVDRFMSLPGATPEGAMMHMAFTLVSRGIPQIYYGDEIGMAGGYDPDNRKDFPGGFPDDRDAFMKAGRSEPESRMFEWTRKLIELRRKNSFATGPTVDEFYDQYTYIFSRVGLGDRDAVYPTITFAFNFSDRSKPIEIRSLAGTEVLKLANYTVLDRLANSVETTATIRTLFGPAVKLNVLLSREGAVRMELPAKSVVVFRTEASMFLPD